MAAYVCVELESINVLPEIINSLLERRIKLTVSKDHPSLCERCSAKGSSIQLADSVFAHVTPVIAKSSPSSPSVECTRPHPQQENAESEPSENPKNESPPVNDNMDESELVACGSALLQQAADNFTSYDEKAKPSFHVPGLVSTKKKGRGSAPKQCQLCEHWITAKNARAHVATHLTIRRLRCTVCGQGFDRMNRASIHIDRCHPDDPTAKVESAMNADQRRAIDFLARKCFPCRKRSAASHETN